tara:strand:+ start:2297 stop:2746 length:450 start_codon:yes stop_codon:yes gene_type:complete
METTYTVKSIQDGFIWTFKYDLNGNLTAFIIDEGILSGKQMKWLFSSGKFPALETIMKNVWMVNLKKNFEITIGEPDLSFEAFWKLYNHKVKKVASEKAWKRLSKKDKMEAIKGIKSYNGMLSRKHQHKAHASTYINQRYWEDDHNSVH